MALRSIAIVGSVVAGLLVSSPAGAVSVDHDRGARASAGQDNAKPDYSFSGNGFNFSISRAAPDNKDVAKATDNDPSSSRSERSWFGRLRRTIEDLFGD
jgi:hypothetical protein